MRLLRIQSAQGEYEVRFVDAIGNIAEQLPNQHAVTLIDRRVADLYRATLGSVVERLPVLEVDASEDAKTLTGVQRTVSWLQASNATKQTVLLAVGGGIVQDIATFSAHIYYRGIKWMLVPTTLLSMSDSCIGAKCGINLNAFKNQLGVFHSPSRVVVCREFINTLEDADVVSGYGEILKLALTGSRQRWNDLRRQVGLYGMRGEHVAGLVLGSLEVKQRIIEEDEYERHLRHVLNYGHTFGHALEALTDHVVPHGHAVAWGLDLVNYIAWQRGMLSEQDFREVHAFVAEHFGVSLTRWPGAGELIDATRRDKKVLAGRLRLVVARAPGSLELVEVDFDDLLFRQVSEYMDRWNAFARP